METTKIQQPRLGDLYQDYKKVCQELEIQPVSSLYYYNTVESVINELQDSGDKSIKKEFDQIVVTVIRSGNEITAKVEKA